eukprot:CAMPEP_0168528314 /NCGR_PEP_ID=MMETSP0405-20121227/13176_1 /TAXON_ID=498012 /ORGANISM="Trichosphaerium sp, Strain Am-I-7 wt" /LENGTH=370 /DNA_ID=CAMNT_0008551697 /DNA_START=415 /DNA_END=1527 /DNA_ORIENTATION=+
MSSRRSFLHKSTPFVKSALFGNASARHDGKDMNYWDQYVNRHNQPIKDIRVMSTIRILAIEWPAEGRILRGRLYEPKHKSDENGVLVIAFSGSGGSSETHLKSIAVEYTLIGCKVLALDYRGFGASSCPNYKKGSLSGSSKYAKPGVKKLHSIHLLQDGLEFYNCATTIITNHKKKVYKPKNIIIHGYSLGGPIAAYTACKAAKNDGFVRGLILDRIMASVHKGVVANGFPSWGGSLASFTHGSLHTEEWLKELREVYKTIPLLVIAAGPQDPLAEGDKRLGLFAEVLGFDNARREVVKEAGHKDHYLVFQGVLKVLKHLIEKHTDRFSNRHVLSAWCGYQGRSLSQSAISSGSSWHGCDDEEKSKRDST